MRLGATTVRPLTAILRYPVSATLLLLAACTVSPVARLECRYEGSDRGYAQALWAARQWSDACGLVVDVRRSGRGIPLREVAADSLDGRHGFTRTRSGEPVAMFFEADERAELTIAHEMGHAMGVGNVEGGIMDHPRSADVVTAKDCEAVR